jgi:hypothetical protein
MQQATSSSINGFTHQNKKAMKKPDMFLIISDTVFAVIFSILALISLFTALLFSRVNHIALSLFCLPLIWTFVNEIRKEIAKDKQ